MAAEGLWKGGTPISEFVAVNHRDLLSESEEKCIRLPGNMKPREVASTGSDLSSYPLWEQGTVGMLCSDPGPLGGDTFLLLKPHSL